MESIRIQADAIVVSPQLIHRPGQIVLRRGTILECTANRSSPADLELPDTLLSPGLVNAHTHLEFSDFEQPFAAESAFPQWIRAVVQHRRRKSAELPSEVAFESWRASCIEAGMQESHRAGVAVLADIVTRPWSPDYLTASAPHRDTAQNDTAQNDTGQNDAGQSDTLADNWVLRAGVEWSDIAEHLSRGPRVVALAEILGLDAERLDDAMDWGTQLAAVLDASEPSQGLLLELGLSPHSPYSLRFDRLQEQFDAERYLAWRAKERLTVMHVAESLEEREWLELGAGPFRTAFEQLGVSLDAPRPSIAAVIDWLATRRRSLLVHGNYLQPSEIEQVARAEAMSVVYCPRTHAHFRHTEYPLKQLVAAGVNVVLATDSRASNPDLSVWSEVNVVRERHAWVSPQWLWSAVTCAAAQSLGVDRLYGTLEPGKRAAMNISRLAARIHTSDLLDELTTRPNPFRPLS